MTNIKLFLSLCVIMCFTSCLRNYDIPEEEELGMLNETKASRSESEIIIQDVDENADLEEDTVLTQQQTVNPND